MANEVRNDTTQVIIKTEQYKRFFQNLGERIEEAKAEGSYEIELGGIPEYYFYVIQAPLTRMGYTLSKSKALKPGGNVYLYVSWFPELI